MRNRWRYWIPGSMHGLARGVGVYGVPCPPDSERLGELLGRCEQLRTWTQVRHGFELDGSPEALSRLDQAIGQAPSELGGPMRIADLGSEAGLYLGSVIVATIAGARWRLWPNGHPVVQLASGRDLDVTAMASDRVSKGAPLLTDVYARAAAGSPG